MNRKTTLIGSDSDPAIQNRKAAPQTKIQNREGWSRREFLSAAALAGTGALLGSPANWHRRRAAVGDDEDQAGLSLAQPLSRSAVRGRRAPYAARASADVQYVKTAGVEKASGSPAKSISSRILLRRTGQPSRKRRSNCILSGLHPGCVELVGKTESARSATKGKDRRRLQTWEAVAMFFLPYHGVRRPRSAQGFQYVVHPPAEAMRLLAEGKIDGFLAAFRRTRRSCGRKRSVT